LQDINKILQGDTLQILKTIENQSINLIICDPPYNIKKDHWDKIHKQKYTEWIGSVLLELQRVLKPTGSLYFFHNSMPFIAKIMTWMEEQTNFQFKQMIVWNKKFKGSPKEGYLQGYNEVENLRNYQKMAEYILFYTFQDETGLSKVMLDLNNFPTLRAYFRDFQNALGLSLKQITMLLGRRAEHCFYWNSTQWCLPTKETYEDLCKLPLKYSFVRKEYEVLRQEYEVLRQEYESQRYTFNNQKTHHSVWNYDISEKNGHLTPKPIPLLETIIKYSSNINDIVLDPFAGSGSSLVAARNLQRRYIGIEKEKKYIEIAHKRLGQILLAPLI